MEWKLYDMRTDTNGDRLCCSKTELILSYLVYLRKMYSIDDHEPYVDTVV